MAKIKYKNTRPYEAAIRSRWQSMINRAKYGRGNYGKFGVSVCEEWKGDTGFESFYKWSMENGFSRELCLDRIDTYGNYCPENCRWTTRRENNLNATNTAFVTVNGEKVCLAHYAESVGIDPKTLYQRLYKRRQRGWPEEKILEGVTS